MEQSFLPLLAQLLKFAEGNGNHDSMKALVQEEIRKSQNQDNNEMLKQILVMLDQKQAAELQEANQEKEKYKLEAEFLKRKLQEIDREKRSAEKTEKMKDIAALLAGLSVQNKPSSTYNKKQNSHASQPSTSRDNYKGDTLPWVEPSKGNYQSAPRGGKHGRGFHHRNFQATSNQNFQQNRNVSQNTRFQQHQQMEQNTQFYQNSNIQQATNFQQIPNPNIQQIPNPNIQQIPILQTVPLIQQVPVIQQVPYIQQNPSIPQNPHFQQNPQFQQNTHIQQNRNFQQNTHYQQNHNIQQNTHFQQNHNMQQKQYSQQSGEQHSSRYRGTGQRGGRGRGRGQGRSVSIGRNAMPSDSNDPVSDGAQVSTSHSHGFKAKTQQWVSTENISYQADVPSHRGRGNTHGRGGGRGGQGNVQQEIVGGQQPFVKKNRKKYPQEEHAGHEKQHASRKNDKGKPKENDQDDPEENCHIN